MQHASAYLRLMDHLVKAAVVLATYCACATAVFASPDQGSDRQIEQQLQLAQEAQKNKDYERSVAAYQKILTLRPDWALIHQSLGVVYHLQSRYPEAISSFQHALELDPKLWGSDLFLGMDLYRTNQFSKAIPALEEAMRINPELSESETRFWLGSSFLALDQFTDAIRQFRQLVELKPKDLEALFNLAQTYSRFSSALFTEIGKVNPESAEAHRLQGEWFEWRAKLDRAVGEYMEVAALRPDWEGVHQSIGRILAKQGQTGKAVAELEKELEIMPHNVDVLNEPNRAS
jgi:protein O-GlcNAc transferase